MPRILLAIFLAALVVTPLQLLTVLYSVFPKPIYGGSPAGGFLPLFLFVLVIPSYALVLMQNMIFIYLIRKNRSTEWAVLCIFYIPLPLTLVAGLYGQALGQSHPYLISYLLLILGSAALALIARK